MKMKKLALLFMTGALLMSTIPCYGSSVSMVQVTEDKDQGVNYTQLPSAETLKKDLGFLPKAPGKLACGYTFTSGDIAESFDLDSKGKEINRRKSMNFKYTLVKGKTTKSVTFSAEPKLQQSFSENYSITKYGEINLYYNTEYANYLGWIENDIYYSLIDANKKVTKTEMIDMAKGIIDMKTDTAKGK